ncbi:two pore potassium channel b-like [Miscanthus floridulus]|uniref:two pore potassium channel b-like n=1 Tax=Miscanthus floridulus TaxID=154761 RepID=UPI00345968FB
MMTVGYGDLVLASNVAKLLACAFVFAGVALVGTFLSKAADHHVENQEALLFRALQLRRADDHRALRAMEANKVCYKLYTAAALLAALLASEMAFLVEVEGMRPVDAFYCVCASVTTLGYGDRSFSSVPEHVFAAAWITVSTVVVALFFLYAAERGVPVVAVDGEFEGYLRLRDLMDAAEPLTETKRRGKKENRLVTDSGTHINRARMTIYPQTPLFF